MLDWNVDNSGNVTGTLDEGSSSYAGIVTIAAEYLSNLPYPTASNGAWIQGYTDVRFQVSGSFSASYLGLSISAYAGEGWHQYAVDEVQAQDDSSGGYGIVDYWAAQYF